MSLQTAMLEHTPKSRGLSSEIRKLDVDFHAKSNIDWGMINLEEIDPRKARSGLFALLTARLEDAHEFAVHGQNRELGQDKLLPMLEEVTDQDNQIEFLLMAIGAIRE